MSWFFLQPMYDDNAYPETWVPLTRHKRAKPTTNRPHRRAKLNSTKNTPPPRRPAMIYDFVVETRASGRSKVPRVSRPNTATLFAPGDHPARNPRRRSAIRLAVHRVN